MLNYFKCRGESAFLYHSRRCRRYLPISKNFSKLFCGQFPCKIQCLFVCGQEFTKPKLFIADESSVNISIGGNSVYVNYS